MACLNPLLLRCEWGGRRDSLDDQIQMTWQCWQRFAAHGRFMDQVWYTLNVDDAEQVIPLPDFESLREDMTRVWEQGDGANYGFAQAVENTVPDVPPRLTLSLTLARPQGWDTLVANNVVMHMDVGIDAAKTNPLPVEWLLSIGTELVKDFVDVWNPDAVSLDSRELRLDSSPGYTYPTIGYVSWLSESVADPSTLPPAPIRESYKGGTILGISPDSPHPVEDATQLAESIYTSNILNIIPFIQGQPNPE